MSKETEKKEQAINQRNKTLELLANVISENIGSKLTLSLCNGIVVTFDKLLSDEEQAEKEADALALISKNSK